VVVAVVAPAPRVAVRPPAIAGRASSAVGAAPGWSLKPSVVGVAPGWSLRPSLSGEAEVALGVGFDGFGRVERCPALDIADLSVSAAGRGAEVGGGVGGGGGASRGGGVQAAAGASAAGSPTTIAGPADIATVRDDSGIRHSASPPGVDRAVSSPELVSRW